MVLLERSRGGITLTAEGQQLLPHMRRLCADYASLQQEARDLTGLASGLIRIGAFSSVTIHWLPSVIRAFQEDYPAVAYEFLLGSYEEIEQWVREGRADLGFTREPAPQDLVWKFLEEDSFVAVLPPSHRLTHMASVSPHDLEEDPFLLVERDGQSEISELIRNYGLHFKVRYTMWDDQAVMAMIGKGMDVSISTRLVMRRCPWQVTVRPLALPAPAARRLGVVTRGRHDVSRAAKRFLTYLDHRRDP